jgi:predicted oxidoreductase
VIGEDKALPILKAAWDRGINTIDTANTYSNGESERIIAKFIEEVLLMFLLLILCSLSDALTFSVQHPSSSCGHSHQVLRSRGC